MSAKPRTPFYARANCPRCGGECGKASSLSREFGFDTYKPDACCLCVGRLSWCRTCWVSYRALVRMLDPRIARGELMAYQSVVPQLIAHSSLPEGEV